VREPERWATATARAAPARVREIFAPGIRARTLSALIVTLVALITWWTCNAFLQALANSLAGAEAVARGLDPAATSALKQSWIKLGTNCFNWGGLVGTLLTIPVAKWLVGDLRELVGDLLSPAVLRRQGYFQPEYVQRLWQEHQTQRRDHRKLLWTLLAFELWHSTC